MARAGDTGAGWLASFLGAAVLVCGGFAFGLIVGIVSEEPELVAGEMMRETQEVDWSVEAASPDETDVALGQEETPAGSSDELASAGPAGGSPVLGAPVASPAVSAPPPTRGWAVQVGAFKDAEAAEELVARLEQAGFPAYVRVAAGSASARWRVRVGPVDSRAAAQELGARLERDQALPIWVLSEAP